MIALWAFSGASFHRVFHAGHPDQGEETKGQGAELRTCFDEYRQMEMQMIMRKSSFVSAGNVGRLGSLNEVQQLPTLNARLTFLPWLFVATKTWPMLEQGTDTRPGV